MKIDTSKKTIKLSILALLFFIFCIYVIFKNVQNYIYFAILVALILHGMNAIFDFIFGLPMQVGYSRVVYHKKGNETGRIIGLLLSCAMVAFGLWWIIKKPI